MLALFLIGCGTEIGGPLDAAPWTTGWSRHLVYRSVGPDGVESGGTDTAAAVEERLDGALDADGDSLRLVVRALTDDGTGDTLRELVFATTDGLAVTEADGAPLDPPVVLLGATWSEGEVVASGDHSVTVEPIGAVVTWYGSFADGLTLRVEGPPASPLAGTLRFAKGIGLVQFGLGDLGGDLAWYDPTNVGAEAR